LENTHRQVHCRPYMDLDDPVFRRPILGAYMNIDSIEEELARKRDTVHGSSVSGP